MTWNSNPFNGGGAGSAQNNTPTVSEGMLGLPFYGIHVDTGTKRWPISAALLEKWKTDNKGLLLLPNYPDATARIAVWSSDYATVASRPKLVIYTQG